MKTLKDILLMSEQIIQRVEEFGYSREVKVYRGAPTSKALHLIVKEKEDEPLSIRVKNRLKAKLSDDLNCEITVIVYQNLENLGLHDIEKRSALMTESALLKVFKVEDLNVISFGDMNEEFRESHDSMLEKADQYLKDRKKKSEPSIEGDKESNTKFPVHPAYGLLVSQNQKRTLKTSDPVSEKKKAKLSTDNSMMIFTMPLPEGVSPTIMSDPKLIEEAQRFFTQILSKSSSEPSSSKTSMKR
jgi:hypothetical protein